MYLVGKVIGTHGIKGELKIKSDTTFNRFDIGNTLFIGTENSYKKVKVNSHRVHQGFDLITVNNLFDINLVLEFVGKDVFVKEHDREKDNAKIYYEDLIDSEVIDEDGKSIGIVNDIIELPKGKLLEVVNGDKKALIPYVDEFILNVDIENKVIKVHLIEGMIWE